MTSSTEDTNIPQLATLPRALLDGFALVKGHPPVPDDQVVPVPLDEAYPVASAVVKTEMRRQEVKQENAKAAVRQKIGEIIDGGVFVGQRNILGRTFNLYAAPQDLADASGKTEFKFSDAQKLAAATLNLNGHDGADYATAEALVDDLQNSNYGKWFIPTRELLVGRDAEGNPTEGDSLFSCARAGKLPGIISGAKYGSSTVPAGKKDFITATKLPEGIITPEHAVLSRDVRYRLVRLVPA